MVWKNLDTWKRGGIISLIAYIIIIITWYISEINSKCTDMCLFKSIFASTSEIIGGMILLIIIGVLFFLIGVLIGHVFGKKKKILKKK